MRDCGGWLKRRSASSRSASWARRDVVLAQAGEKRKLKPRGKPLAGERLAQIGSQ